MAKYMSWENGGRAKLGVMSVPWAQVPFSSGDNISVDVAMQLVDVYPEGQVGTGSLGAWLWQHSDRLYDSIIINNNLRLRIETYDNLGSLGQRAGITLTDMTGQHGSASYEIHTGQYDVEFPIYFYADTDGIIRFWYQPTADDTIAAISAFGSLYQQIAIEDVPDVTPDDPSGPGGGGGDYNRDSDSIDIDTFSDDPNDPNFVPGAADSGLLNIYRPTKAQLEALGRVLFDSTFVANLPKYFSDPADFLISLHMLPVTPPAGAPENIVYGDRVLDGSSGLPTVLAARCPSQYMTADMGTLDVAEYWGNALDYSPNTKGSLFLPYIGFVSVDLDDFIGGSMHIVYNIDILTGACTAIIKSTRTQDGTTLEAPLYAFSGTLGSTIPISTTQGSDALLRLVTATASFAASPGVGAALGVANTALAAIKPDIGRSGSLQGNSGILSNQTPYLIISRPIQSLPEQYAALNGYPANITRQLSTLSGFTVVESVNLTGIQATDAELSDIRRALTSGVILPTTERPSTLPDTTPDIILYHNNSAENVVVKTLTNAVTLQGVKAIHADNIETPTIEIASANSLAGVNYVYMPMYGRYYYVTGRELTREGLWTLRLRVDVLMTYCSEILQQTAIVSRNANVFNLYLPDNSFRVSAKRRVQTLLFPRGFSRQPTYILAIAGKTPAT